MTEVEPPKLEVKRVRKYFYDNVEYPTAHKAIAVKYRGELSGFDGTSLHSLYNPRFSDVVVRDFEKIMRLMEKINQEALEMEKMYETTD